MQMLSMAYIKEKWQHAGFQKYFRNLGLAFSSKMYSLIASFFVGALVARYLGPERYGVLNYVMSFVTIFAFLASFGIDNILVRDLVKFKEKRQTLLNTALLLKIIGAAFVVILIFLLSLLFKNDGYTSFLIFLYSLQLFVAATSVIESYFQSEVKYKYIFRAQLVSTTAVSLLKLFFIYAAFGTGWFVVSLVFESLVYSFVLLRYFNREHGTLLPTIDFTLAKKLLSDSWPFLITTAFYLVYSRIDQVMIGKMLSNAELGIYSAAVKLAEIWYFVPTLICSVILPSIVLSKETSLQLYKNRNRKLFWFVTSLGFFFALFEFIFAHFLVSFIFGGAYSGAIAVLRIYTWAGVFISMILVLNQILTVENRTKVIMVSSCAGALLNILFNFILIPRFGIVGSAWATLLSYAFVPIIIAISHKGTAIAGNQ
jgi:O-antigen/teichoic acid export membrane protein